jgi:hypothetical protein
MNFDLMGWQMAMYLSTVNAVRDRAETKPEKTNWCPDYQQNDTQVNNIWQSCILPVEGHQGPML